MSNCGYCGKDAGMGRDFHPMCADQRSLDIAKPQSPEQAQMNALARSFEPVLKKAVYRGVLLAALTITGIWLVLGIVYAFATSK